MIHIHTTSPRLYNCAIRGYKTQQIPYTSDEIPNISLYNINLLRYGTISTISNWKGAIILDIVDTPSLLILKPPIECGLVTTTEYTVAYDKNDRFTNASCKREYKWSTIGSYKKECISFHQQREHRWFLEQWFIQKRIIQILILVFEFSKIYRMTT